MDENCSGVQNFCLFVQKEESKLDPITDIFRTMHVTAFGLHRLEATAPWGVEQEKQSEAKVTPSGKKISPTDLAHFAMLSRGNCWLSVGGNPEPIPLTGAGLARHHHSCRTTKVHLLQEWPRSFRQLIREYALLYPG